MARVLSPEALYSALREAHEGRQLSELAQRGFRTIQGVVARSAALSEQISHASREQAAAKQHVSGTMQTIASVTDQSATGANESTRAVKDLVDLAEQLTHAISRLRVESGTATRN